MHDRSQMTKNRPGKRRGRSDIGVNFRILSWHQAHDRRCSKSAGQLQSSGLSNPLCYGKL